jgi:hypothetical protein
MGCFCEHLVGGDVVEQRQQLHGGGRLLVPLQQQVQLLQGVELADELLRQHQHGCKQKAPV